MYTEEPEQAQPLIQQPAPHQTRLSEWHSGTYIPVFDDLPSLESTPLMLTQENGSDRLLAQQEIICLAAKSTREALQDLLNQLKHAKNPPLKMLRLSGNTLKSCDLELICTIIKNAKQLVYLDLSNCGLRAEHTSIMASLGKVIEKHPTLLSLIFSDNWLTEQSQLYLATTMLNTHILQLVLTHNQGLDRKTCEVFGNYLSETSCNVISLNITTMPLPHDNGPKRQAYLTVLHRIACELKGNQQKLNDKKYQASIPANSAVPTPGLFHQYSYSLEAFNFTQPGLDDRQDPAKPQPRMKTIST